MFREHAISDREFKQFQGLIYQSAGIVLSEAKRILLVGRLSKRLRALGMESFSAYHDLVTHPDHGDELQHMVDLLTTNETYFFREPQHFEFLQNQILPRHPAGNPFRIWSAASSSGEEAYTMAMVLAEHFGASGCWEVFGSDISTRVLSKASAAVYPMERTGGIPVAFLKKFCLKGVRAQEGNLLISPELRKKVRFSQINLLNPVTATVGEFDSIFLRNVMIYFDLETKRKVVGNLLPRLKRGGIFVVGHSESLSGIAPSLDQLRPTIYRKP